MHGKMIAPLFTSLGMHSFVMLKLGLHLVVPICPLLLLEVQVLLLHPLDHWVKHLMIYREESQIA